MIKRIVILLVVILIGFAGSAIAADPLFRMVNPELFPGDQDAMIVGQIISPYQENYVVKVLKVINGSVEGESILVDKNFTYLAFSEEHYNPQLGDFCVLAIKKYDGIYKVRFPDRVVKADSGNYETLKCIYEDVRFQGGDVPAIQWYVNSGGTENGFGFASGKAYVTRPNGEIIDITDISLKVSYDENGNEVYSNGINNPQTRNQFNYQAFAFIMIIISYILLKYRKNLIESI